jgi:hypothetical protein
VYTTWKIFHDRLEQIFRLTLWLMAFLHHDGIAKHIFKRAAKNIHLYEPVLPLIEVEAAAHEHVQQCLGMFLDSDGRWSSPRFSRVMSEISSFSLIEFDRVNLECRMHVLMQD